MAFLQNFLIFYWNIAKQVWDLAWSACNMKKKNQVIIYLRMLPFLKKKIVLW